MNRRQFLVGSGASLLIAAIGVPFVLPSSSTHADGLTFEIATDYAARFYTLKQWIPNEYHCSINSLGVMQHWMQEIVPMFEYEGIDAEGDVGDFGSLVYPPIKFEDYEDGLRSNHVLGTTSLFDNQVTLSSRFVNPISPWYGRERSVITLIHELVHAQGVKFPGDYFDEESSAQMISLEIASAMVNKGNSFVLASLLDELGGMFSTAARYLAIQADDEARWYAFRDETFTDPFDIANFDKSDRFWKADIEQYHYILQAYNYTPINAVYQAVTGNQQIDGVRLPINWALDMDKAGSGSYAYAGSYGVSTPEASPTPLPLGKPLIVDDIAYLFDHVEEYVEYLQREG